MRFISGYIKNCIELIGASQIKWQSLIAMFCNTALIFEQLSNKYIGAKPIYLLWGCRRNLRFLLRTSALF